MYKRQVSLYSLIFELSRSYQTRLTGASAPLAEQIEKAIETTDKLFPENATVACQGVEGAYSQLACDKLFKLPNVLYFSNFDAVFSAIEKGPVSYTHLSNKKRERKISLLGCAGREIFRCKLFT